MRKLKVLIMCLFLCVPVKNLHAQGYPVIDVANLLNAIEQLYQYYQQVQNTIEQVQNTYKRIEQAAQTMQRMNWDDLKNLGDNFAGMSENPFEVITGIRNSAQDITKAVNNNMNKVNNFRKTLTDRTISFGGVKYSIADLAGAGDSDKNISAFVKNGWDHTLKTGQDAIAGYVGKLSYKEKMAIARKYGMSPENYASLELINYQMKDIATTSNIKGTMEYQRELLTQAEADAEAFKVMAEEMPDGSTFAALQLLNSNLAQLQKLVANLHSSINYGISQTSAEQVNKKQEEALAMRREAKEKKDREKSLESNGLSSDLDIF